MLQELKHKFGDHQVSIHTETLIVGTFNPGHPENTADFFYGRSNQLWALLPAALGHDKNLYGATKDEKFEFMAMYKVDFIDLVEAMWVEPSWKFTRQDRDIDRRHVKWRDIGEIVRPLPLRRAFITRKTFADVPNIGRRVSELRTELKREKGIDLHYLPTPASYRPLSSKLNEWKAIVGVTR